MFVGSRGRRWVKCAQLLSVLLGLLVVPALAQNETAPKAEVFGGISYFHPGGRFLPTDPTQAKSMSGWGTSVYTPFSKYGGGVLDASGNYGSGNSVHGVMFGAEFKFRRKMVEPFVEGMVGWTRRSPKNLVDNGVGSFLVGGGLDVPISNRFAIRAFRADYIYSFSNPGLSGTGNTQTFWNSLRVQSGVVVKFGVPTVARIATVACFADPSKVKVGEPISAKVTSSGFAHRRQLTYEWRVNDTMLSSTAESAVIETASLAPGEYTVKAAASSRANAKQHETATCSATFAVLAVPTPEPPAVSEASAVPASSMKPETKASTEVPATAPETHPQQPPATAEAAQLAPAGATTPATSESQSASPVAAERANVAAQPATAPAADKQTSSPEAAPTQLAPASNEAPAAHVTPQVPAANITSAKSSAPIEPAQQPSATAETAHPAPSGTTPATAETRSASSADAQPATAPAADKQTSSPRAAPTQSAPAFNETPAAHVTPQVPATNTVRETPVQQPSATAETAHPAPSGTTPAIAETQSASPADAQPATAPAADKQTSSPGAAPTQSAPASNETPVAHVTPQVPAANITSAKSSAPIEPAQQPSTTTETAHPAPSGTTPAIAEPRSASPADAQPATAPAADKQTSSPRAAQTQSAPAFNETPAAHVAPQVPAANITSAKSSAPIEPAQQPSTTTETANVTKASTPKAPGAAPARSEQRNSKRSAKNKAPETVQPNTVVQSPEKRSASKAPERTPIVAAPATVVSGDPVTITLATTPDKTAPAPVCKTSTGTLHAENGAYTLDTAGVPAGKISVTCTDDEGHPVASTLVEVIAPSKPNAQARKLNSVMFNNTRRPARVDNVGKQILRDAAHALQQSEPGSKLVLVGNAHTSELETNKNLAAQRATNAKAFLMDKQNGGGVDASSITVQTGKANARRVDVYLAAPGTTGKALKGSGGNEGKPGTKNVAQHRRRNVVEK